MAVFRSQRLKIDYVVSLFVVGSLLGCPGEASFDSPTVLGEICDDGIDNDGNGLIDCAEPACERQSACQLSMITEPSIDAPFPACASIEGDRSATPIDIIWVIDSSPSMIDEMGAIQQNLNDFVTYLTNIKLDIRVILLGGEQICVPEPLSINCADGPQYRHISDYVGSHDSLEKVIEFYPRYRDFLRPTSRKAIIVTTDDNSEFTAEWFTEQLEGLVQPGFGQDYVIHSIVAFGTHPRGCFTASAAGNVYLRLTESTQGVKYPVCETDWTRIFDELANGVVGMVNLPCAYEVPDMAEGMTFAESQIHLTYFDGTKRQLLPRLSDASSCGQQLGWFFEGATQTVRLCPSVCESVAVADVDIAFGCTEDVL